MAVTWLADALRGAGLVVRETDGWADRAHPGAFEPLGVLLHHTAAYATEADPHPSLGCIVDGRPDAPGPLGHVVVDRNAECWVVAAGRAHHTGPASASGPLPDGDGNAMYVGVIVEYAATNRDPTQYATSLQKSTAVTAAATIVARLGRDQHHVRAHRETSPAGRTDPWNWDMVSIRDSVRQSLERTGT